MELTDDITRIRKIVTINDGTDSFTDPEQSAAIANLVNRIDQVSSNNRFSELSLHEQMVLSAYGYIVGKLDQPPTPVSKVNRIISNVLNTTTITNCLLYTGLYAANYDFNLLHHPFMTTFVIAVGGLMNTCFGLTVASLCPRRPNYSKIFFNGIMIYVNYRLCRNYLSKN